MNTSVQSPRILIVENDFLIPEMVYDLVRDLGYGTARPAHRLPSALSEITKDNFDCVFVNIGIDDQKHGIEIADILKKMRLPFGFVTGYNSSLAERHADVPILQKPFSADQLRDFLVTLVGSVRQT